MNIKHNLDTQPTFQPIKRKKAVYDKTDKPIKRNWERNDKRKVWESA